jgi:hypothetical protein
MDINSEAIFFFKKNEYIRRAWQVDWKCKYIKLICRRSNNKYSLFVVFQLIFSASKIKDTTRLINSHLSFGFRAYLQTQMMLCIISQVHFYRVITLYTLYSVASANWVLRSLTWALDSASCSCTLSTCFSIFFTLQHNGILICIFTMRDDFIALLIGPAAGDEFYLHYITHYRA